MQPTPHRRREIEASNVLLVGLFISGVLWRLHLLGHTLPATAKPMKWWMEVGVYLLIAGWYYAIRLGKQWAKYLLLVLFVGSLVLNFTYHPERLLHTWRTSWPAAASYAIGQVTQLWALVLLFHRPSLQPI
ncbi:hypothetical protein [Hymenobacter negativus]|uniref:Uncharacterized protein n=1 Tax=Hymenobacter negativus TaxID=2795026 RepID=A0ABS3QHY8_9BACT|nr:hypothetical protein [Hymenobacter negativus]MBO2010861.1 hypothetical protein [Hymenobacter negativus]